MFEKVNPSHPDKVADRIAGAIVDLCYTKSRNRWSNESSAKLDLSTADFGECSVECQHSCSAPGGMDLRIESDEGKDIWEDWIRNGYCEDEINDERYYVFQEDEHLREDGILEIL